MVEADLCFVYKAIIGRRSGNEPVQLYALCARRTFHVELSRRDDFAAQFGDSARRVCAKLSTGRRACHGGDAWQFSWLMHDLLARAASGGRVKLRLVKRRIVRQRRVTSLTCAVCHSHPAFAFAQFVECGTKALRESRRRTATVVMQKDDARLLAEHVIVQCDDFQIVSP